MCPDDVHRKESLKSFFLRRINVDRSLSGERGLPDYSQRLWRENEMRPGDI